MRRSTSAVLAVVGLGVLAASCDEGRLVSGPGGVLEAEVQPITGRSSINAGELVEFSTAILLSDGALVTDAGAVAWSAEPASAVTFPGGATGYTVTVRGRAPAAKVTLKADVNHALLQGETRTFDVEILILGVEVTRPAGVDTSITAIGNAITLRARGIAEGGASADSGGVTWTHRGSNTQVLTHASRDTLRIEAISVGTDTFFVAREGQCTGKCADTVVVRVQQAPARVEPGADVTLDAFGQTATLSATVYDANDNLIPAPQLTYALVAAADSVTATVTSAGIVTARGNGTADVRATAGTASATSTVTVTQAIDTLTLDSATVTLTALQAQRTVVATALDPGGAIVTRAYDVAWTSSDAAIATVTASATDTRQATIRAIANGTASVIATSGAAKDTVVVTVGQVVDSVAITSTRDTLTALGQTAQLTARPLDANDNETAGDITWAALSADTASIDGSGLVTAHINGTARFTASAGGVEDTIGLTVRQVAASVTITPNPIPDTLLFGDTQQLSAAVADSLGSTIASPTLSWTSTNTSAITVDGTGLATGRDVAAFDSAQVVATSGPAEGKVWAFTRVTTVESVVVTPENDTIDAIGATAQLSAKALNQNGSTMPDEKFTWTSVDPGIATVDASGLVTSVANGTTKIVATSDENPSKADTATVLVAQKVTSVAVSPTSHTFNALTHTKQFTATATDSKGVTVTGATFTWTNATAGITSVNGTGLVTADAVGTTQVIATSGGVADSADVTVRQVAGEISTTPARDTVGAGGTITLTATVRDSASQAIPGASVTWESLNTSFATVNASGVVTGVATTGADSVGIRAQPTGRDSISDTSYITVRAYVMEFDGNDYGNAGDVLKLSSGWTIEAWVKPANTTGTQFILSRGGVSGNNTAAYGVYLSAGKPAAFVRSGSGGGGKETELVSNTILSTTEWSHVAVRHDGAKLRIYINGAPTDSVATTNAAQTDDVVNLIFGASDNSAANAFTGKLDEVRFWSVARLDSEIAGAYKSTLTGTETSLLAWWPFSAGTGNPVDQKGSITLTLGTGTNTPAWVAESPVIP